MTSKKTARSAKSGKKVSLDYARRHKTTTVQESAPKYASKTVYAIRRTENDRDGWLGGADGVGWPNDCSLVKSEMEDYLKRDGLGHSRARIIKVRLVVVK